MLSPSFVPYSFLIYSTQRSAFLQSPQRKFYGIFDQDNAEIFASQDSAKYSSFFPLQKLQTVFYPVPGNKGLGVKRVEFDRILLYWKVSMNNPRDIVWDKTDPPVLENCAEEGIVVLHLHWERASCHRSLLRGEWLCLLRTTLMRASGPWGSAVLPALPHWALWLSWKLSEGPHLFVTSHWTRSWLLCCDTLLFSEHQFKSILCSILYGCVSSLIPLKMAFSSCRSPWRSNLGHILLFIHLNSH